LDDKQSLSKSRLKVLFWTDLFDAEDYAALQKPILSMSTLTMNLPLN
jgi:hypothetical protein